jgi:cytochrome P450
MDVVQREMGKHPGRTRPLAAPPQGSGLRAVLGKPGTPWIGHSVQMLTQPVEFLRPWYREFGPVSWTHSLGRDFVLALGPDATQAVFTNRDRAISQKGWEFQLGRFFPRGLMLLDGAEHHHHRLIMQEAFTRPRLAGYVATIDAITSATVPNWPGDDPRFRFRPAMKALSLDIATAIFMAAEPGPQMKPINDALTDLVLAATSLVRFPVPGLRWSKGLHARRDLERYFSDGIARRRASDDGDLFSALCHARTDDGAEFSDTDIVDHMIFLMMAAHDTSTSTATTMAYHLAANPHWQERARAESLAVCDGPVDIDTLESLHTLDLVMNESLRLVTPLPAVVRKTVADTDLLGHFVPADTLLVTYPWLNHLLEDYWTEPDTFDPERFADPRREDRSHRYAFSPFGGGAHKCIGMFFGALEVKAVLHRLLLGYRLEIEPGYSPRWDLSSMPFPADGMPITLRPLRTSSTRAAGSPPAG